MNEFGLDSPTKITPELVRADMQFFLASSYGRPQYDSSIRQNPQEAISIVIGDIISAGNPDPTTLLKMSIYLGDLDQGLMFDYFSGKDYAAQLIKGFNSAQLRRKIFEVLQDNLYGPEANDLQATVALLSLFRHFRHREHGGMVKTKFPQRLRYGKDEMEMLTSKMTPKHARSYVRTVIAEELRDLEKPQRG